MPPRSRSHRRDEPASPSHADVETVLAGRVFLGGRLQCAEVGISGDGKVVRVARTIRGGERRELGTRVILPAAVDLHVHFRDPGPSAAAETFESGTVAAALGGVGVVGEMPNTDPPVSTLERFAEKRARGTGRLAVDAFLYALPTDAVELPKLGRAAGAFKLYLSPTTGVNAPPEAVGLPDLLSGVARTGLPLTVHAEDPTLFRAVPRLTDLAGWDAHRPVEAEWSAIDRVLRAAPPSLRLHIAHVTSTGSVDRIRRAGHSFEATPHHLLASARPNGDALGKVNPPLRAEPERAGLWDQFRDGHVPVLASDHAPHSLAEKSRPFDAAPSGVPGVETSLPLLLAEVRAGRLELGRLIAAACDRPARWMGFDLGRVAPGHRANLIVVDFRHRTALRGAHLHSRAGWTPFEGREAIFPTEHYRDGEPIVLGGEFVGTRTGRWLRPSYAAA